jgi:hypothetical protein
VRRSLHAKTVIAENSRAGWFFLALPCQMPCQAAHDSSRLLFSGGVSVVGDAINVAGDIHDGAAAGNRFFRRMALWICQARLMRMMASRKIALFLPWRVRAW